MSVAVPAMFLFNNYWSKHMTPEEYFTLPIIDWVEWQSLGQALFFIALQLSVYFAVVAIGKQKLVLLDQLQSLN